LIGQISRCSNPRMVKRFGAASIACGVVASFCAFACDPRCSDGFVEQDHCEQPPSDDAATPGDDRRGYLTCTDQETGASEICGPDSGCCGSGSQCAKDSRECSTPSWFATCDGPEDCGMAEQCWLDDRSIHCSSEATPYFNVRCHTDLDCPKPDENPCLNGYCLGDPDHLGEPVAG
jgi:hypothetical protein